MSGVFGVCSGDETNAQTDRLTAMTAAMTHRSWYQVDTHVAPHAALGRVGIGVFNRCPQPACDGDLVVFFTGELYDAAPLRRELETQGVVFQTDTFEELTLRLYQAHGVGFVNRLHGPFVTCIWDGTTQTLWLVNDRLGRYQTFYAHYGGRLVFAPELKAFACDRGFEKRLDLAAAAECLRFQRLLGDKTFFEGVKILPYASILRYDARADALTLTRYWDYDHIPAPPPSVTFEDAVAETARLLRAAMDRLLDGGLRPGLYLSGGLDSRLALGLATEGGRCVTTVNFGQRQSTDVIYARQLADRAGSVHYYFEFTDGRWVEANAPFHLALTEGLHNWVHMHGITTLPAMRGTIDFNLTGWAGDEFLAPRPYELMPPMAHSMDDVAWETHLFHAMSGVMSWPGFLEAEARLLFTDAYAGLNELAFESLRREACAYLKFSPERRLNYWQAWNHTTRLTHNYANFMRSHIEMRYPFGDYPLIDFVLGLPLEMRLGGRLQAAVINREMPHLAMVPYASNSVPITDRRWYVLAHKVARKAGKLVRRYVGGDATETVVLYADYEEWLRTDLRAWSERLLFDERTLARGIFNPDLVRSLWARHLAGHELHTIGRLAPLMSFEMMMRLLFDGDPAPVAAGVEGVV